MPTPPKGPRLGGSPAHERLILANLAQSLFEHGKITTTLTKAKRVRPVAEKLVTAAKRNTLHTRRQVMKTIRDKDVVHKLFAEIGPSFATRDGGYTRITKTMPRKGDNAPMAVIELIGEETVSSAASRVARAAASKAKQQPAWSATSGSAAEPTAVEPTVAESDTAESIDEAAGDATAAATEETSVAETAEETAAGETATVEDGASTAEDASAEASAAADSAASDDQAADGESAAESEDK